MAAEMREARKLTPYDTGERLFPDPWDLDAGHLETGDDYGKVDFDTDEGSTVCTVHVERRPGGGWTVVITPLCDDDELTVTRASDVEEVAA